MATVTVIIPFYNASKTLENTLRSVIDQTMSDIEIICVDDGSTDLSSTIVKNHIAIDNRIQLIIFEKNKGLLQARIAGANVAKGRYTMFVDADDILHSDACEKLSLLMDENKTEIIKFGTSIEFVDNFTDKNIEKKYEGRSAKYSGGTKILKKQFYYPTFNWNVWNRIYDTNLLKKSISHLDKFFITYGEDIYVTFFCEYFCNNFLSIKDSYYTYVVGGGVSKRTVDPYAKIIDLCKTSQLTSHCISFLKEENNYEKLKKICNSFPINLIGSCQSYYENIEDEERKQKAKEIIYESYKDYPELLHFYFDVRANKSLKNSIKSVLFSLKYYGFMASVRKGIELLRE